MLQSLSIRDLAVVGRVDLSIATGMSVITGETGAGKSILVDALSLVGGGRGDSGAVRTGAERTEIAAEFDLSQLPAARQWLLDQALDDDRNCLLRRVVRADGGSRGFINGRAATLLQLRELAGLLVEIHGQHEHQALLSRSHQLDLLDQYAQNRESCQQVSAAASRWRQLTAEIDALRRNNRDGSDLVDFLSHALGELNQADPRPERLAELEQDHRRLAHAGELIEGLSRLEESLAGDDGASVERQIGQAQHEIGRLLAFDSELGEAAALIDSASVQLSEAMSLLRRRREAIDLDPARLAELERDLGRLHALARKHRVGMDGLDGVRADLQTRLASAQGAGARLDELEREQAQCLREYQAAARVLGQRRTAAAQRLSTQVTLLMQELGMAGGSFVCSLESKAADPTPNGDDEVEFLVTANPGMPPRPLRKVASGGELARISLAIKVATIALDDTPVLVFDEVDSGIGGAVAEIVGRKLRQLGQRRQVLCVTHLPQVAACAHHQYRVSKLKSEDRTESQVEALDDAGRVAELARMLGGVDITAATTAAAADLLQRLGA
ncbi:MAG: DNA repair protein RecN [Rhodanobacteraceae bacterium]|nr:DNA repair protein RecN [Rhodanobacteraceae bacterium]